MKEMPLYIQAEKTALVAIDSRNDVYILFPRIGRIRTTDEFAGAMEQPL